MFEKQKTQEEKAKLVSQLRDFLIAPMSLGFPGLAFETWETAKARGLGTIPLDTPQGIRIAASESRGLWVDCLRGQSHDTPEWP